MKQFSGLKAEILFTLIFLLGAAVLLGGLLMVHISEQVLLDRKINSLSSLSNILAHSISGQGDLAFQFNTDRLTSLAHSENCTGWWVFDSKLELQTSFSTDNTPPYPRSWLQNIKLTQDPQRVIKAPSLLGLFAHGQSFAHFGQPLFKQGKFSGVLILTFSLDDIQLDIMRALKEMLLYIVAFGGVLMLVGYYLFQRNVIIPATQLLKATNAVREGNMEMRLPLNGPKEISEIAVAYNEMVNALALSQRETLEYIHSLEHANHELQRTRDQLVRSEKLASVGHLAAGLAHEIGNPLAAVMGYLELLRSYPELQEGKDLVRRSLVEIDRIDYLVRELLDFSRPSDSEATEHVLMSEELSYCIELLKNQGLISQMKIELQLTSSMPKAEVVRNRIRQVFINLLLNAIDACEGKGLIKISEGVNNSYLWIAVSDDGCGIPKHLVGKILDPFFTTKPPGKGTGLGLSVCHRIIADMGGYLEINSDEGAGSCFCIFLPH